MLFFSVSRDRYFQFHNVKNGQRLGGYLCSAWCTALAYDEAAKYAFMLSHTMSGSIDLDTNRNFDKQCHRKNDEP